MDGQNLGVNRQRPPMSSQLNKSRVNNTQTGMAGQNQGGFNTQRPMGQRPSNPNFGAQRPQQMGQNQNPMGQGQMGQRPRQPMNPTNRPNMNQGQMGQRPNVSQRNVNDNPFAVNNNNAQNGNTVVSNRSVPMTQV